jgi:hypothetical protein
VEVGDGLVASYQVVVRLPSGLVPALPLDEIIQHVLAVVVGRPADAAFDDRRGEDPLDQVDRGAVVVEADGLEESPSVFDIVAVDPV